MTILELRESAIRHGKPQRLFVETKRDRRTSVRRGRLLWKWAKIKDYGSEIERMGRYGGYGRAAFQATSVPHWKA